MMQRAHTLIWILLAAAGCSLAQEIVNVRVLAEPLGARFTVDGQPYAQPQTFAWPRGSKHTVSVVALNFENGSGSSSCDLLEPGSTAQYDGDCATRRAFGGWETNQGAMPSASLPTQVITAEPGLSLVKAKFGIEYRIRIALPEGPLPGPQRECTKRAEMAAYPQHVNPGVGVVFFGGACYDKASIAWAAAGEYPAQALAFAGYVFEGWTMQGTVVRDQVAKIKVTGPTSLIPMFSNAKRVTIYTEPAELRVRVDRAEVETMSPDTYIDRYPRPGYFDFLPGSRHVLGASSPQWDRMSGQMYVFKSWSNGGVQDMIYTAGTDVNVGETLVAKFVRGVAVTFLTEPRGLRLNIEGRENWPNYGFFWGLGSKYTFGAPAEQTDSKGRKWTFKGWKHGGPAAQEGLIDDAAIESGGVWYTAMYEPVPQIVLQSSLAGMPINVDGKDCPSPCVIDKPAGTQMRVSVPETISATDVMRHEFTGWTDGGAATRTVTIGSDHQTLQANYRRAHRLVTVVDPADAAVIRVEPSSPDSFYPEATDVAFALEVKPGFKFRRWDGDLAGTVPAGAVTMWGVRTVAARLDKTPYVAPAGVRNAAGTTPVDGVAPGSLITISGASLTTAYEAGPASPLAQTLGGLVVLIGDRILPLIYVSPDQINALLPSDLEPGTYTLSVRPQGSAVINAEFKVVRNAPGLLPYAVDGKTYAVALHEDGSTVTPGSPAKKNELVSVLGTGFGAYNRPVVDGFAVPVSPQYTLLDPVEINFGGVSLRPQWAGAAPGFNGVVSTRFRIPADATTGERELRVSVNGSESNIVLLPVE